MQIKTFQANDMAEALRLVKSEFGPDAMILTSKKMRRQGLLGYFTKPYFEVTALLDNRPRADFSIPEPAKEAVKQPNTMEEFQKSMLGPLAREVKELRSKVATLSTAEEKGAPASPPALRTSVADTQPAEEPRIGMEELKRFLLRALEAEKGVDQAGRLKAAGKPVKEATPVLELRSDIEELKQILLKYMGMRKEPDAVVLPPPMREPAPETRTDSHREADELKHLFSRGSGQEIIKESPAIVLEGESNPRSRLEEMRELLRANGVESEAVETLLTSLIASGGETVSDRIRERLHTAIVESVVCSKQMTLSNTAPRILAFVGPSGVGKTTTIAKLAALAVKQKARVSIISIDTYRVGAVDQLKAYAVIMGLPLAVAETPDALAEAITANSDKHLIFIDTAGRNHRDQERLLETKSFLEVNPDIETHLCLAATTRDRELTRIFDRFSILPVNRMLFTKLDECESFGCIINMYLKKKAPLSYFSTGQRVPEDLLVATPQRVADLVIGEMTP